MAETPKSTAAATQPTPGPEKRVEVRGRPIEGPSGPAEKVTNDTPIPDGDVTGFRVASEAAQDTADVGPVKGGTGDLAASTHVRNSTLRQRDEKEFQRRGHGTRGFQVSANFEGLMMIENGLGEAFPVSGSYTGPVGEEGLVIRRPTPEEEAQFGAGGVRLNRRQEDTGGSVRTSRGVSEGSAAATGMRGGDLARGSGAGGGGNPMIAGQARGAANPANTGAPVGKGTTSVGAGPSSPQGGGSDTRKP